MKRWVTPAVALGVATMVVWHRWVTPWHEKWGATAEEIRQSLPGDDLVKEPAQQNTRAIGIDAEPGSVWQWIVQIGADRGGFYSYEWLENLFGLGIHNSEVVVPEWQHRAVGDLVFADAEGTGGWYVVEFLDGEALVLQVGDVRAGRPLHRDEQLRFESTWSFVVRPARGGGSRLVVRERAGFGSRLTELVMSPIGIISFVMSQKMLREIKARAEAVPRVGHAVGAGSARDWP